MCFDLSLRSAPILLKSIVLAGRLSANFPTKGFRVLGFTVLGFRVSRP